jgi:hypothetical protein
MPQFMQTFTQGLNACTGCPNGGAPMGLDNNVTDELELITNDTARNNEPVCATPGGGNSGNIRLVRTNASISGPVLIFFADGTWTLMNVVNNQTDNSGEQNCAAGNPHTRLNFNSGAGDTTGMNQPGGTCQPNAFGVGNAGPPGSCTAVAIGFGDVVRYRIRVVNGVPELQRSSSANFTAGFQTVASGIEDLQVQYTQADGTITAAAPGAPQVVANNYASVITQVQVTLASRSEAQNIQGMTSNPSAANRIRGRLTSTGTPRSSLIVLAQQPVVAPAVPTWQ